MSKRITAIWMSIIMFILSIQVCAQSENDGYGENYQTHSGVSLYEEIDYQELESELQALCRRQEENGYTVTELTVVYVMPDAIDQWLAGKEEERFFGIPLAELESEFGANPSFYFGEDGLESYDPETEYNWGKIAANVGAGCGIILVGVTINALTGGAATCVLAVMVKGGISCAALSGTISLAVETASGMSKGEEFSEALAAAAPAALESASAGFLAGTVISGVAVQTGLIGACFAAGTSVATPEGQKKIEEIKTGDLVYAYNEAEMQVKAEPVTAVSVRTASELVQVRTSRGDTIISTADHPWYVEGGGWRKAGELLEGERLRSLDGADTVVSSVVRLEQRETEVYNLTVADSHTYYVGTASSVLVHNVCKIGLESGKWKTIVSNIKEAEKSMFRPLGKMLMKSRFSVLNRLGSYIDARTKSGLLVKVKGFILKHKKAIKDTVELTGLVGISTQFVIPVMTEQEDPFFD